MSQALTQNSAEMLERLIEPTETLKRAMGSMVAIRLSMQRPLIDPLVLDSIGALQRAARHIATEQPLIFESLRLATSGNMLAANLTEQIRLHELNRYPFPEVLSTLRQPAVFDSVLGALRAAVEQYSNGALDLEPEVGEVLVEQARKPVLTLVQLWMLIEFFFMLYGVLDDVRDGRIADERDRVADERYGEFQRQFAEFSDAIDGRPDYLFATTTLNLRSGPSTDHEKLRVLEPRTVFVLLERQDDWLHVEMAEDRSQRGWVSDAFVEDLD